MEVSFKEIMSMVKNMETESFNGKMVTDMKVNSN